MTPDTSTGSTFHQLCAERGRAFPLLTDRLLLSPFTAEDLHEVWGYWRLPETTHWMSRRYEAPEQLRDRWLSQGSKFTVRRRSDGVLVGDVGARLQDSWAQQEAADHARGTQAELDWTLAPQHQAHGYAREAVRALMELAADLGVRRMHAGCFAENTGSWRLMEALGMRRETSTIRESLHRDLGWRDGVGYAVLAEELPPRH
ncbi:GNAT family N-acetyltransferase [Nesterenkonia xinjiangensis]|uniref:RimJ/RimL family protein N-acetyltransferase n=1 Tax=Nesterenkonia xinjiangensis TaxID=225327 RepID=A0A7Z0K8V5_9MICC|nr:GNAT family protein [Nesterenkonia xinjiangensis]NYJ77058.1 RimJ/RimL family protein N-acetyltransferase [Nesterenkonia xinjiangensis]